MAVYGHPLKWLVSVCRPDNVCRHRVTPDDVAAAASVLLLNTREGAGVGRRQAAAANHTITFQQYAGLINYAMKATPWVSANGEDIVRFDARGTACS
jgi:hypothetical protein